MPTAMTQKARHDASTELVLGQLLARGREFSAEYPQFLANHLPMVIVALHRLGADDARLKQFFAIYREANHLAPMPPAVAPIGRTDWTAALGDRSRERDYRDFFTQEVGHLGIGPALRAYLPVLTPAIASSALHP